MTRWLALAAVTLVAGCNKPQPAIAPTPAPAKPVPAPLAKAPAPKQPTPEDLQAAKDANNDSLMPCPACGRYIAKLAPVCPHCGWSALLAAAEREREERAAKARIAAAAKARLVAHDTAAAKAIKATGGRVRLNDDGTVDAMDLRDVDLSDGLLEGINWPKLIRLHRLDLSGSSVTDELLKQLHGARSLYWVNLRKTKCSPAAIEELRQNLPAVTIEHD